MARRVLAIVVCLIREGIARKESREEGGGAMEEYRVPTVPVGGRSEERGEAKGETPEERGRGWMANQDAAL